MVSITVQTLILGVAISVCIVGAFKMPDSKCKVDNEESIKKEIGAHYKACMDEQELDADSETAYFEMEDGERAVLNQCVCEKVGVVVNGKYNMTVIREGIDKHMSGTEQEVKDDLYARLDDCEDDCDAEQIGEMMGCVGTAFMEACGLKKPEKKEKSEEQEN